MTIIIIDKTFLTVFADFFYLMVYTCTTTKRSGLACHIAWNAT